MTPQVKPYPVINKLIDVFGNWLKRRQEIREIRELDSAEFANIAHELCVTPADLDTFVRQGPHAVDELPKLLTALGIRHSLALSLLCCVTWHVSAPHANKSTSVTETSMPVPRPSTMRSIASMRRQSMRWA